MGQFFLEFTDFLHPGELIHDQSQVAAEPFATTEGGFLLAVGINGWIVALVGPHEHELAVAVHIHNESLGVEDGGVFACLLESLAKSSPIVIFHVLLEVQHIHAAEDTAEVLPSPQVEFADDTRQAKAEFALQRDEVLLAAGHYVI